MGRWLALAGIIGVCATACNASSSVSPSSYRHKVLGVCGRYRSAIKGEERRQERAALASPEQAISTAPTARLLRRMLIDVRKIKPPPSQRPLVRRWLEAGDQIVTLLGREDRVLTRDTRLVEKELRHLKLPRHKLTPEEIRHPTAAIINAVAAHSPAWRKFMRDTATIARQSLVPTRRFQSLASKLGVSACTR
jgi:hypothetical protein